MPFWNKVKLYTAAPALDIVAGVLLSHGLSGLEIQDAAEFSAFLAEQQHRCDEIETQLLSHNGCQTAVIFYLPADTQGKQLLYIIQQDIQGLRQKMPEIDFGSLQLEMQTLRQEDWDTAWKQYYHPIAVGKRLMICPSWESSAPPKQRVPVRLDPDMAFGTGTHETTRLCLELLEDCVRPDISMLDIGTGSGILAISALLLGAQSAAAVDIDRKSVEIAQENALLNGVSDRLSLACGDLGEHIDGHFDVICANIVADVILRLAPSVREFAAPSCTFIASGILEDRKSEMIMAIEKQGFCLTAAKCENDWCALQFTQHG